MRQFSVDPCTFSNPTFYELKHLSLEWNVNFDQRILSGKCCLTFEQKQKLDDEKILTLDTRDLVIKSVREESLNVSLEFEFGPAHQAFGTPLNIHLSSIQDLDNLKTLRLVIEYETSPSASALQWIDPNATLGKRHPYLFSQCQAIHARSICPLQDTPSVKFKYDAAVNVQSPLVALMSACSQGSTHLDNGLVQYNFEQKINIPSYLLALVVGDLVCKQIGPVSKVWTEKEMIDVAAKEFEEVGDLLKEAEELLGEYVWGVYDLLVLPPTFPFGGMENPCLTFVTPTIIAKDKSLVDVVQHEISHSWTGNLVTNCSWEHFWLNEGFTTFAERKLVGMHAKSEAYRQFGCIDGWRTLAEEIKRFGPTNQLTQLVTNLTNVDPDDAFSSIPYEKGHMLLYYLEELLGGPEIFNKYLKAHIEKFKGQSIDSTQWKEYLYEYFSEKKSVLDEVDWETWLHKPGMPPVKLNFDQTFAEQVTRLVEKISSEKIESIDPVFFTFFSDQKIELLSQLLEKDALSLSKIEEIDTFYEFSKSENYEILFKWIRLCIKAKWEPIIKLGLKFVSDQGRMKFTRPVYRDLFNWEAAREQTIKNFEEQKKFMHQTTASLVAKDLGLEF